MDRVRRLWNKTGLVLCSSNKLVPQKNGLSSRGLVRAGRHSITWRRGRVVRVWCGVV